MGGAASPLHRGSDGVAPNLDQSGVPEVAGFFLFGRVVFFFVVRKRRRFGTGRSEKLFGILPGGFYEESGDVDRGFRWSRGR